MSEWTYRQCTCGLRIHINMKCDCGGDPWKIAEKAKARIEELLAKRGELMEEVEDIDNVVESLKKDL